MKPQRTVTGHIVLGEPLAVENLCPDCLHATIVQFDLHLVTEMGVTKLSKQLTVCAHCYETENQE